jgi:hypothetical protein
MVVSFFGVHVLVMVAYEALVERLGKSQHPAARRLAAAEAVIAGLISGAPPYDGPDRKIARGLVQTTTFLVAAVFYILLLVWLGRVLDWLESP